MGWCADEDLTIKIPTVMQAFDENEDINFYVKYTEDEDPSGPEDPEDTEDVEEPKEDQKEDTEERKGENENTQETVIKKDDKTPQTGIKTSSIVLSTVLISSIFILFGLRKKTHNN